jgi:hypothetical protein
MNDGNSVRKHGILVISATVRLVRLILGDSRLQVPYIEVHVRQLSDTTSSCGPRTRVS